MIELTRQAVYFPNPKHPCFNVQNFGLRPVMQDGIPAASPTMHGSTESHSSCPLGLLLVVGCGLWLWVVGCGLWLWVVVVGCGLWLWLWVVACGLWLVLVLVLVLVVVVVVVVVWCWCWCCCWLLVCWLLVVVGMLLLMLLFRRCMILSQPLWFEIF